MGYLKPPTYCTCEHAYHNHVRAIGPTAPHSNQGCMLCPCPFFTKPGDFHPESCSRCALRHSARATCVFCQYRFCLRCAQAGGHADTYHADLVPSAGASVQALLATLPNGQEIHGTVQPNGTVHVDHWPAPTITSTHPHGIVGAIVEALDPEEYARVFLGQERNTE